MGGDGREGHGEETAACAGEGVGYIVAFGGDGGGLGHCLFVGGRGLGCWRVEWGVRWGMLTVLGWEEVRVPRQEEMWGDWGCMSPVRKTGSFI